MRLHPDLARGRVSSERCGRKQDARMIFESFVASLSFSALSLVSNSSQRVNFDIHRANKVDRTFKQIQKSHTLKIATIRESQFCEGEREGRDLRRQIDGPTSS